VTIHLVRTPRISSRFFPPSTVLGQRSKIIANSFHLVYDFFEKRSLDVIYISNYIINMDNIKYFEEFLQVIFSFFLKSRKKRSQKVNPGWTLGGEKREGHYFFIE
jgi:hypothetical protein